MTTEGYRSADLSFELVRGFNGLPGAMSGDRTYSLWGPRKYSGNCMIVLDDRQEVLEHYWEDVEFVGTSTANLYALEQQIPVQGKEI